MPQRKHRDSIILLIAIFKLVKALLLIAAAIGALEMIHRDLYDLALSIADTLHINVDNSVAHRFLDKVWAFDTRKIPAIAVATFVYAGLFLTEGTGLLLRKRWAEYFTAIVTGSFIPLEIYHAATHPTPLTMVTIAVNIAIVIYLVIRIRRTGRGHFESA